MEDTHLKLTRHKIRYRDPDEDTHTFRGVFPFHHRDNLTGNVSRPETYQLSQGRSGELHPTQPQSEDSRQLSYKRQ
jgi:hypothetical protein